MTEEEICPFCKQRLVQDSLEQLSEKMTECGFPKCVWKVTYYKKGDRISTQVITHGDSPEEICKILLQDIKSGII